MSYRIIKTTTLDGRKRVQYKSTGHNGDYRQRALNRIIAKARLNEEQKPKHLGKAGSNG